MFQRGAARHVSVCFEFSFDEGVQVCFCFVYGKTVRHNSSSIRFVRMPVLLAPNEDIYLYKGRTHVSILLSSFLQTEQGISSLVSWKGIPSPRQEDVYQTSKYVAARACAMLRCTCNPSHAKEFADDCVAITYCLAIPHHHQIYKQDEPGNGGSGLLVGGRGFESKLVTSHTATPYWGSDSWLQPVKSFKRG
jgi:hypothetical protein